MKITIKKEDILKHSRNEDHLKGVIKYPSRVVENKKHKKKEKHKKNLVLEEE